MVISHLKLKIEVTVQMEGLKSTENDISLVKIEDCGLSTRSKNCLARCGFVYLQELSKYTEKQVSKFYNLGVKSQEDIENIMKKYGIWYKE